MSSSTHLPATDYEPRDASPHLVLLVGGGLSVGIILSVVAALALYFIRYRTAPRLGAVGRQTSFQHSPHAQTDIAADWTRLDAEVAEHLHTYGWINRKDGVVRIPIDVAMDRLVEESASKSKESR